MKTRKKMNSVMYRLLTIGLISIATHSVANAQSRTFEGGSNTSGGGGTGVEYYNDLSTLTNADLYVDTKSAIQGVQGNPVHLRLDAKNPKENFPSELQAEMGRVQKLMDVYLYDVSDRNSSTDFFNRYVTHADYYIVDEIPAYCPYTQPAGLVLPTGMNAVKIACTKGSKTYLLRSAFPYLSIRQQAENLIHERLMDSKVSNEIDVYQVVAKVSKGLEVLLSHYNLQQLNQDQALTDAEMETINDFRKVLRRIMPYDDVLLVMHTPFSTLWRNGGGLIRAKDLNGIDPSVRVGVGVSLSLKGSIGPNSVLDGFKNYNVNRLGKNVTIQNSYHSGILTAGDRFQLINSYIGNFYANEKSTKRNHQASSLTVGNDVTIFNAEINVQNDGFEVEETKIYSSLAIQDNVSLANLNLNLRGKRTLSKLNVLTYASMIGIPIYMGVNALFPTLAPFSILSSVQIDGAKTDCASRHFRVAHFGKSVELKSNDQIFQSCMNK